MSATLQLSLLEETPQPAAPHQILPLSDYRRILVAFSGGKDSVACVLWLLEQGIPKDRIELHHHRVDGDTDEGLFDWPITDAYVRAFAAALGLRLFFSWKEGGIEREMLRENARTAPIAWETPEGTVERFGGIMGSLGTRLMYPQVTADLRTRWCSSYVKIHCLETLIRHQPRFEDGPTLVITGERAEESTSRARYATAEIHRADLRAPKRPGQPGRFVDHFRPVHAWSEAEVWEIMKRWGIVPHPAYQCGFGRVSCAACIFLSDRAWTTLYVIDPSRVERHMSYEDQFGKSIHRSKTLRQRIATARPFDNIDFAWAARALSHTWDIPIRVAPDQWTLPAGAYGESTGPS